MWRRVVRYIVRPANVSEEPVQVTGWATSLGSIPARSKRCFSYIQPPTQCVSGALSPLIRQAGSQPDRSAPSSDEAKEWRVCLLGYNVVYSVESQVTFRRNMTPQSALLATCLAYSSTLKMDATCFSETCVGFQQTTQRYILEDRTAVRTSNLTKLKNDPFRKLTQNCAGRSAWVEDGDDKAVGEEKDK
jgi:hypothetical protein